MSYLEKDTIFKSYYRLYVLGKLIVDGDDVNDVIFTSLDDMSVGGDTLNMGTTTTSTSGSWLGIESLNGGYVDMKGVSIKYGGGGIGSQYSGLKATESEIYLEDMLFESNAASGVMLINSTSTIKSSEFKNHLSPKSAAAISYYSSPINLSDVTFDSNALGVYADSNSTVQSVSNVIFTNNTATTSPSGLW